MGSEPEALILLHAHTRHPLLREKLRPRPPVHSPMTHPQLGRQSDKEATEKLAQQMAAGPVKGTGKTG